MNSDFIIENGVLRQYIGTEDAVDIPDVVIKIGKKAFWGCQIKSVAFKGNNLKSIDDDAFHACTKLENIMLPEGLVQIGDRAFMECDNLRYIGIPASVLVIGDAVVDSCHPDMFIIGDENTEASKLADTYGIPLKTNASEAIAAFDAANRKKQNISSQTFDIFGESVTCSNTIVLYHSVCDYYNSKKEGFFNQFYKQIPQTIKHSFNNNYNQLIAEAEADTIKRLAQQGVFLKPDALKVYTNAAYNALVSAANAIVDAHKAVVDDANNTNSNITDQLIAEAESKVIGLGYGVIGDGLTMAAYAIDEFRTKQKQRQKAYAEAEEKSNRLFNETIAKGDQIFSDFVAQAVPYFRLGTDAFLDSLRLAEIDQLMKAGSIDSSITSDIDVAKSDELLKSIKNKKGDNSFTIALAIKKYPMNIDAYVYAAEYDYTCPGLSALIQFLGLESQIKKIVDHNKKQRFDNSVLELKKFNSYGSCINYIKHHKPQFTSDEIVQLLSPVSERFAKSILAILQISVNNIYALEHPDRYCGEQLHKILTPDDWKYFENHGVAPVGTSARIPIEARKDYDTLRNWLCAEVEKRIPALKEKAERDEQERKEKAEREERERQRAARNKKRAIIIGIPSLCILIAVVIVLVTVIIPNGKYNAAKALMDEGQYAEAIAAFEAMDDYKDSKANVTECKYRSALLLMDAGRYEDAIAVLEELGEYKDSAVEIGNCKTAILDRTYNDAVILLDLGNYKEAAAVFESLDGYKDSANMGAISVSHMLENAQIGDVITFASVDWIILAKEQDGTLLLANDDVTRTEYKYDWEYTSTSWKQSDVRSYLNTTFLEDELSGYEKHLIQTEGDYVSLLTSAQYREYEQFIPTGNDDWWLRNTVAPEYNPSRYLAEIVSSRNEIDAQHVSHNAGVRPVIKINIQ